MMVEMKVPSSVDLTVVHLVASMARNSVAETAETTVDSKEQKTVAPTADQWVDLMGRK